MNMLQHAALVAAAGVAAIVAAGWLAMASPGLRLANAAAVFSDNFSDGSIDPGMWTEISGGGVDVAETNGRVEVSYAATLTDSFVDGRLVSVCRLRGDFDMQVDFQLLTWPASNGIVVRLSAAGEGVFRTGAQYGMFNETGTALTTDALGSLRLTRTGGVATGYYRAGSVWVAIDTDPSSGSLDAVFAIGAFADAASVGGAALVSFDNLIVNSGELVASDGSPCPITTGPGETDTPTPTHTPVPPTATHTAVPRAATNTPLPTRSGGGTGAAQPAKTSTPVPQSTVAAATAVPAAPTRVSQALGAIVAPDTGDGSATAGGSGPAWTVLLLGTAGVALAGAGAATRRSRRD